MGYKVNAGGIQIGNASGTYMPDCWIQTAQATAGTPSASQAAVANVYHVCTGILASVSAGGTAQTPIVINLRDGASGVGTIIHTWALSAPINTTSSVQLSGLSFKGTLGNAMTLEFASASAANCIASVTITGFDAS